MEPCFNYNGILDGKYILVKEIDSSISSTTYKVFDSTTEKKFLVKIFNENKTQINTEVEMYRRISRNESPLFLKYINSSSGDLIMDDIRLFDKKYIVFENATKGDLLQLINLKSRGLGEKFSKIFFAKFLKAVHILHKIGICIKNIDMKNILLDGDNFELKLTNFEFSSFFINEIGKKILLKEKFRIFQNAAPEVMKGKYYDAEKADIFALGVFLFSLITGFYGPKGAKTKHSSFDINEKLYKFIKNKNESFWNLLETNYNIKFSPEFKKLFVKMVDINPKNRPTIEEIFNDEWMKEIINLNENELKTYEQELINEFKSRYELFSLIISNGD